MSGEPHTVSVSSLGQNSLGRSANFSNWQGRPMHCSEHSRTGLKPSPVLRQDYSSSLSLSSSNSLMLTLPPLSGPVTEGRGHMLNLNIFHRKTKAPSEGEIARKQAESTLAQHRAQSEEVYRVTGSLRQVREANHFAANLKALWEESV